MPMWVFLMLLLQFLKPYAAKESHNENLRGNILLSSEVFEFAPGSLQASVSLSSVALAWQV